MSQSTVEPPNKGHFENGPFVLCSEVVPISGVCHILIVLVFNKDIALKGMTVRIRTVTGIIKRCSSRPIH